MHSSILFWNVANNKQVPIEIIIEKINIYQPNIVGLVEASHMTDSHKKLLTDKFPEYEFQILNGEMFIGIKGKINDITYHSLEESHKFNLINASIHNKVVSIQLVDVYAGPFINKKQPLSIINESATKNQVSFIIGDFNTPYEGVHFKVYDKNYINLHQYADGFTATWPYGIPLLELDQIFIDKKMYPIYLKKFNFDASDHQLLIGNYSIPK